MIMPLMFSGYAFFTANAEVPTTTLSPRGIVGGG